MARKATSQDVATLAGVSRSAVSLVLNGRGHGNIAADKQAAIRQAAEQLNYTPNAVALSLRNQRTHTIGVVTDAIATTAFGGNLLQGASDAAAQEGYLLLVIDTHYDYDRELEAYQTLHNRQVDAFLFAAMSLRPYHAPERMLSAPSALANCFDVQDAVSSFIPDDVAGGRHAAQALIDAGHRDIVMLSGTHDVIAAEQRETGFRQAMTAAGLSFSEPVVAGWEMDKGFAAASHLLDQPERPSAIICANDRLAVGVALAAGRLGVSIPGDLSIVGYDDDENIAPCMTPALTTVALPHREMGDRAMQLILSELSGLPREPPVRVLLDCPLVLRESVAPPG
ncbi:MAG: LacI family DNA-binding transcriptional regulator [Propionibacteriaceae bacterium]